MSNKLFHKIRIVTKNLYRFLTFLMKIIQFLFVNGYKLEKDKQYNINFATFGAIAGEEYFINRGLLHHLPNKEAELIKSLADIIKNN